METEFEIKGNIYRIKKMKAVEWLGLRSQIDFDDTNTAQKFYEQILEKMEVQIKDKWLPVKQGETYYPANVEYDLEVISTLVEKMMEEMKEVFTKSSKLSE